MMFWIFLKRITSDSVKLRTMIYETKFTEANLADAVFGAESE